MISDEIFEYITVEEFDRIMNGGFYSDFMEA